jgi:hypothetical protein
LWAIGVTRNMQYLIRVKWPLQLMCIEQATASIYAGQWIEGGSSFCLGLVGRSELNAICKAIDAVTALLNLTLHGMLECI